MTVNDKISAEYESGKDKLNKYGKIVAEPVIKALNDFCVQNSEFAQAVMQSDKSVIDCIWFTVKGCKNAISDLDVYRRAVQFYFPGADVHMALTVDLGDGGFSNNVPITVSKSKPVELSLDSLLDF